MGPRAMAVCMLAAPLIACSAGERIGQQAAEVVVENGRNLNGRNLNGRNLKGSELGTTLRWVSLESVQIEGKVLEDAWLEETVFYGLNGKSSLVTGTEFLQSEFQARTDAGETVRLRVPQIDQPEEEGGTWRYWVEYRETDGEWYPICVDESGSLPAIPINGWWDSADGGKVADPEKFTFACPVIGTIGKCLEMGYEAWETVDGSDLSEHHQACVRAMRADYCGDGTSHTTEGELINLYDGLGIQLDTEDSTLEAEWDENGARCFSENNRALDDIDCFQDRATDQCGVLSHFDSGTHLMTEMP